MASLERTVARLRSRIQFLKDGDANSALFHSQARFRKRKKFIAKIETEDGAATSQRDKQEAFFSYFDGLLGTAVPRVSALNLDFFPPEWFRKTGWHLS